MEKRIKVIKSELLSTAYDPRFVVLDQETGEIVDDAQGYGYKTIKKAYAAFAYKTRDKSKDQDRKIRDEYIRKWMKDHKSFVRLLDGIAFEIAKGSWGPEDKVDAKLVRELMEEQGIKTDIMPGELLRIWRKGYNMPN